MFYEEGVRKGVAGEGAREENVGKVTKIYI